MNTKQKDKKQLMKLAIHHFFNIGTTKNKSDFLNFYNKTKFNHFLTEKEVVSTVDKIWDVPLERNGYGLRYGCPQEHFKLMLNFERGEDDVQKSIDIRFEHFSDLLAYLIEFNNDMKNSFYKIKDTRLFYKKNKDYSSYKWLSDYDESKEKEFSRLIDAVLLLEGKCFKKLNKEFKFLTGVDSLIHSSEALSWSFAKPYKILFFSVIIFSFIFMSNTLISYLSLAVSLLLIARLHKKAFDEEIIKRYLKDLKEL
jgi:hypothetical protein